MLMEEIKLVDAPSDAQFWGGVAIGTVLTVAVGWVILC
ncbi:hypothetical protein J2S24_002159 [Thermoanaerobacter pentosaceus]|uniref:Uncharacterized protein n=1 Tax=Thermoanaerobacter pentosaceus TaxID=694059 RepID=A0ABT9M6Y4_9THEO|nr:hypothetical protein [Thermoanaerobacter pentosaceus]